jgi:hypothetical protein
MTHYTNDFYQKSCIDQIVFEVRMEQNSCKNSKEDFSELKKAG